MEKPATHMDVETFKAEESFMSPLNKIIWYQAFRAKATEVTIRDGRKFTCKYFSKRVIYGGERKKFDFVKVDPAPGQINRFVPCGTYRMKDVTDVSWISENKKAVQETGRA